MTKLTDLPNIGQHLANQLSESGIDSPQELTSAGSENVFIRIRTLD